MVTGGKYLKTVSLRNTLDMSVRTSTHLGVNMPENSNIYQHHSDNLKCRKVASCRNVVST
jgi:hypothetical protein